MFMGNEVSRTGLVTRRQEVGARGVGVGMEEGIVTIAVLKNHDQNSLGREGFIWLTLPHHCSSWKYGPGGRN